MEPLNSLKVSAALFTIAALGGIVMAVIRMGKVNPPAWLALVHGLLASAGLTVLAYAWCFHGVPDLAKVSLLLFALAALGGVYLNLRFHWQRELIPTGIMWGHAVLAVAAYALLLLSIFRPVTA